MNSKILIIGVLVLLGCSNNHERKSIPNFQERELSFLHLRFGYDTSNIWIKKPENILMLHETFKQIGYKNLVSDEQWTSDWNWYIDVNKSPKNLIDSLELTFEVYNESPKYYREFWLRRMKEKNEEVVYHVIREIKQIMSDELGEDVDIEMINDTLETLLSFEYPERELTNDESNKLLQYLLEIGLHKSAYNLISGENGRFEDVKWNKSEGDIIRLLLETQSYQRPWFEDDTK